VLSDPKQ